MHIPDLSRHAGKWLLLAGATVLFTVLFEAIGLPASLFMGPMAAGILLGASGFQYSITLPFTLGAQGIVGCMLAASISFGALGPLLKSWPLFAGVVVVILVASSAVGLMMTRWQILPGTTAIWGTSPGGALPMILMAETYGGDPRLVAFMQYLRISCIAVVGSIIAHFYLHAAAISIPAPVWFPAFHGLALAETAGLAIIGALFGEWLGVPSGALLMPLVLGVGLRSFDLIDIELPRWLIASSYAVLGWNIGLRFTRPILIYAVRLLPQILLAIAGLMLFCGALAVVLARTLNIDLLTAYLATSPGGFDSMAIIAASSKADISFVMTLQTFRFVMSMFLAPVLARSVVRFMAGIPSDGAPLP